MPATPANPSRPTVGPPPGPPSPPRAASPKIAGLPGLAVVNCDEFSASVAPDSLAIPPPIASPPAPPAPEVAAAVAGLAEPTCPGVDEPSPAVPPGTPPNAEAATPPVPPGTPAPASAASLANVEPLTVSVPTLSIAPPLAVPPSPPSPPAPGSPVGPGVASRRGVAVGGAGDEVEPRVTARSPLAACPGDPTRTAGAADASDRLVVGELRVGDGKRALVVDGSPGGIPALAAGATIPAAAAVPAAATRPAVADRLGFADQERGTRTSPGIPPTLGVEAVTMSSTIVTEPTPPAAARATGSVAAAAPAAAATAAEPAEPTGSAGAPAPAESDAVVDRHVLERHDAAGGDSQCPTLGPVAIRAGGARGAVRAVGPALARRTVVARGRATCAAVTRRARLRLPLRNRPRPRSPPARIPPPT